MLYESHITVAIKDAEMAQKVADDQNWKTSEIKRDITLGDNSYFYLTTHCPEVRLMFSRLERATAMLRFFGVNVIREKIELTIHDTKIRSTLPVG